MGNSARLGVLALGAAVCALMAGAGQGQAQNQASNPNGETVGQKFRFLASNLPPPFATPATASNSKKSEDPNLGKLQLPPGFKANLFAEGLSNARWLQMTPNGDVLLAESSAGKITLLRDADHDGKAELRETFAQGFQNPHGMAIAGGKVYIADALGIYSYPYKAGDTKVSGPRTQVTKPGAFGVLGGHWTRNLAIDSTGKIFVAIGSNGNINGHDDPWRAAVSVVQPDGSLVQYGTGLRNPVGIEFYPGTNDLYVAVNERDGEGDELVPDYLTRVQQGGFYGWPWAYLGQHEEPSLKGRHPELVAKAIVPDVLFRSHSAPLGIAFYTGTQFPEHYRGGAFVAHHGSWNAANPRGYKIVYVPFADKRPSGGYENFALGFWTTGKAPAGVMGRPVDIAQAADGSILVSDDIGNAVWRIAYTGQ